MESKQSDNYSEEDDPEREPMDIEEQDDPIYVPEKESCSSNETTTDLTYFIAECVRYNVSDRAAPALYNAALHTMGELQEYQIVDKSKIRQEKEKFGTKHKIIQNKLISNNRSLMCIGVDGKRNTNTMVQETRVVNGQEQVKQMRKTHEHQVYTIEPSGQYLCNSDI